MDKVTLHELLALANECPTIKPLSLRHKTSHPSHYTFAQKRTATALFKTKKRLKDLQISLNNLLHLKRSYYTEESIVNNIGAKTIQQNLTEMPINLTTQIKKIKHKLWLEKQRLKIYEQGRQLRDRIIYTKNSITFEDYLSPIFIFFQGLARHESIIYGQFTDIAENKYGKQYPLTKQKHIDRWKYILNNLKSTIFLNAHDARWLIRHMVNVKKRLARERSLNLYLPKQTNPDLTNEEYRTEIRGSCHKHKYVSYDLSEITSMRDLDTLMTWWGCQLRDDERDYLIDVCERVRQHFVSIFVQTMDKTNQ